MSYWKDYCYVDAFFEHPVSKRKMPWTRLNIRDVGRRIVAPATSLNCYTTAQCFKDATSLRDLAKERGLQVEPLKKPKAAKKNGHDPEETAREERMREADELPDQQPHYHGLYFDFDCAPEKAGGTVEEALRKSWLDTKKLLDWFQGSFPDIQGPHMQVWFSGRKGFHLVLRPEPFGIRPHNHLTYIVKSIACELADLLELTTLDRSVYTVPRMWRIPNTQHPVSKKFKIELSHHELVSWDHEELMEKATHSRAKGPDALPESDIYPDEEYENIPPDRDAVAWFQERFQAYDAYRDLKRLTPRRSIVRPEETDEYPACVKDILYGGPKVGGPNRNRVVLPLANFFHDAGLDIREAHSAIAGWTQKFYPEPKDLRNRVANSKSVVESVYRSPVKFSCRFIRSVGGPGDAGRVACVGEDKCPWVQNPADQEPAEVPMLHLSEASKGCYIGTKIKTAVHIAALAGRPFEIPTKGRVVCQPDPEAKICGNCPNNMWEGNGQGKMEFELDAEDRAVLGLINVHDNQKKFELKSKCGIPQKCFRHRIDILEHKNVEEVQIIPMVDYAQAYRIEPEFDENDLAKKSARHVVQLAYFLGYGIEANKKYLIEATVLGHPKDQKVCFLFDKAIPAQNDIDQFKMTPELHEKLKIFQPKEGQTIEQKFLEIHRDLTANVHQIGGRTDISTAIDLCYHSVIGFTVADQFVNKGWFELLIIGDTGTGKSTMVERIMRHYGLGEMVAGEDSRRTGLVYASIQMQGQWVLQWGKVPQNDRRLLVIDEFAGIPQEEVGKMTQLRSEGKARPGGVNQNYETWARTRLIFVTNPRNNRGRMAGFNYGVQAVSDLFKDAADLRRVDMAMVAERDEVESSLINKRWDKMDMPHQYTADLCRSLVLWAWSREPHQVEWEPAAYDKIIECATWLADTYDCDISLAERSDLKLKLCRIAAACAARMFSTDDEAKKVYVKPCHVEFVAQFLDRAYRKGSMSFFEYARKWKQDNHFTDAKKYEIKRMFASFGSDETSIVTTLLEVDIITKSALSEMVNLEKEDFHRLWKFLVGERMLWKIDKGYRKTVAFTRHLKVIGGGKSGYEGNLSVDYDKGGDFEAAQKELTTQLNQPDEFNQEPRKGEDPPF